MQKLKEMLKRPAIDKMKITRRQLRRIIKETVDVMNAETGELMSFADTEEYGVPNAPDKALPNIMKRLGLTNSDGTYKTAASSPGYQADMDIQTVDLNAEDWQDVYDEVEGKRHYRKNKAERARLNIDNLMTRLEDWALNAGEEYAADNPGADLQGIAWDLAQGAEYSFEPDEWEALLYTGPFEGDNDLYTYIADLIA